MHLSGLTVQSCGVGAGSCPHFFAQSATDWLWQMHEEGNRVGHLIVDAHLVVQLFAGIRPAAVKTCGEGSASVNGRRSRTRRVEGCIMETTGDRRRCEGLAGWW